MSLDTEKLHKLRGKGFEEVYRKYPEKWKEMVDTAKDYAGTCVSEGEKVRIGDIVTIVQNAIKIDPEFEKHLAKKGLTQKYWVVWFAEYIVEQVYPQPVLEEKFGQLREG
jgi:hypothetical protein